MKLSRLVPMLRVTDMDASIRFYTEMLEFECINHMEGWACLSKDGVELMLALPNQHEPVEKASFTGSLYFNANAIEGLWNKLKERVEVVYPIEDFDYGMREFAIRDNNGYMLQFGEELQRSSRMEK